MNQKQKEMVRRIHQKMDKVRKNTEIPRKEFWAIGRRFDEIEHRLSELQNLDDDFDSSELKELDKEVDGILKNAGIP